MAGKEVGEGLETHWEEVRPKHYRAIITLDDPNREVRHDYYICTFVVVEVDTLLEDGVPRAVFRGTLERDDLGDYDDESELEANLRKIALDAPEFQLSDEFDASVEAFEAQEGE